MGPGLACAGPPKSFRGLATRAAELAGVPAPQLSAMPNPVIWVGGLFNPMARAARENQYQFRTPFVLDSTAATEAFGIKPTPLDDALHETIADLRPRSRRRLQRTGIGRHHDSRVSPTTPPAEVVSRADRDYETRSATHNRRHSAE